LSAYHRKFDYGVTQELVAEFVQANACVRDFLNKYDEASATFRAKAMGLTRFFRWLKVVKGLDLTPAQFLNLHVEKRSSSNVIERRWALQLALEFSRDNPDLKGNAAKYVYIGFFLPIKMLCDYHEVPLTSATGLFRKAERRKYADRPFTVAFVKKALSVLSQRERAVCMVQLQSGQGIKQVLVDINRQARRIFREIDMGTKRIRFDFPERKGNSFPYFSFISRDAIQEIQKWRPLRTQILENLGVESEYLFIMENGEPLPSKNFFNYLRLKFIRHKIYQGPLSMRSHLFRKFFEQEASPPERGISKAYVTFMMGHSSGKDTNGVQINHPLDVVGGTYDNAPNIYPNAVENEYAKLEPYINIYSENAAAPTRFDKESLKFLELFTEYMDRHPEKMEKFERFLIDL
jgi:integrase